MGALARALKSRKRCAEDTPGGATLNALGGGDPGCLRSAPAPQPAVPHARRKRRKKSSAGGSRSEAGAGWRRRSDGESEGSDGEPGPPQAAGVDATKSYWALIDSLEETRGRRSVGDLDRGAGGAGGRKAEARGLGDGEFEDCDLDLLGLEHMRTHTAAEDVKDATSDHEAQDASSDEEIVLGAEGELEAAAEDNPASKESDLWRLHFSHELSDDDVVALRDRKKEFRSTTNKQLKDAWPGEWRLCGCDAPVAPSNLHECGIGNRLQTRWRDMHSQEAMPPGKHSLPKSVEDNLLFRPLENGDFVDAQQRTFFSLLANYKDVLLPAKPYPNSIPAPDPLRDAYVLHCVNHILRSRFAVRRNDSSLKKQGAGATAESDEGVLRDQGFTRPRVLILVPMKNAAFQVVHKMMKLAVDKAKGRTHYRNKFVDQFGPDEVLEEALKRISRRSDKMPAEHTALFHGNTEDDFSLGIRFSRMSLHLYEDFYSADVIVASPISLAVMLGNKGADFLSSIEVLVIDQADVLTMQNWQHVDTVVKCLNHLPKEQHGTDIMRVHEWQLKGNARHFRQTVMLSSFGTADLNAMFNKCSNFGGMAMLHCWPQGVLGKIRPLVHQVFERVNVPSLSDSPNAMLEYFKAKVFPRLNGGGLGSGVLLFIPHYFDFVHVRNFIKEEGIEHGNISEYSKPRQIAHVRRLFARGERRLLLYTERTHFYNRCVIRGCKDIVFYGLPYHAHFYSEIVNLMEEASLESRPTVTVLFSRFNLLELEGVVGAQRARKMVKGESSAYMFC
eukprot:evm.model.scf_467.5 EVM.evm.TU.scf_467.5   scf_467:47937-59807(+)